VTTLGLVGIAPAGCGDNSGDRAASGGLLGAGAAVSGLTGGSLLGGAVGGAATSPDDVNLGRPVWR
jgi:hypothetical protein